MSYKMCNKERCVPLKQFHEETEELSKEEAKIAKEAKQGTLEILQDALKKKDKVLMQVPGRAVLKGEERELFWMERHAILTEDVVKKLLAKLKTVTFKKNINMCGKHTIAYVYRGHEPNTVFLCEGFWKRQRFLGRRSQPGTIIHEVSHFLGTEDITYTENIVHLGCGGYIVKGGPARSTANSRSKEDYQDALAKAFLNATNIQHEFELTINHSKKYEKGKYLCCGETKRYSVCEKSVPDYFHTCNIGKKWETKTLNNIIKNIIRRSKSFPSHLGWLYEIVEEMGESLKNFKVTDKDFLWNAFWNAANGEDELALNHGGNYVGDKYSCCEETARYSMCDPFWDEFFPACRVGKKWEILVKDLCERSKNIKDKLRQYHRIANEMGESLRKAKALRKVGLSMDIAGGAATAASLLLAPTTFGLSVLVAGGLGMAGGSMTLISTMIFSIKASTKKKELYGIFAECQSFLDDVESVIASLNHEPRFRRDFDIHCCSCCSLEYITILINLIVEQVKSRRDDVQRIHMYMVGIIQCAHLLEILCEILSE